MAIDLAALGNWILSWVQPDGNYRHIGFHVGESLTFGLIHNALANISLCDALVAAGERIGEASRATTPHLPAR